MIRIPDFTSRLVPYKAGKPIEELAREQGLDKIVKLASNENPLGPSPKAVAEIHKALNELHRYSDPKCYIITKAISLKYNIDQERIMPASGSDALIQYIISAFTYEGDELLSSEGTFIGWYVNVNKLNRKSVTVPLKNHAYDLDAILAAITPATRMIYLANPNNPTGTAFYKRAFEQFLELVPDDILIILDEAYTLYASDYEDYPNGLLYNKDNLIVLRTFSKDYGLAGLRLGVCFGHPELIANLYKAKLPFEPSMLAQAAVTGALRDDEFLEKTRKLNRVSLRRFRDFFDENGIKYTNSIANFLLLIFPDEHTAVEFTEGCMNSGLILRHVKSFGIPNGVRINSGTEEETDFAIEVINKVYTKIKHHHELVY